MAYIDFHTAISSILLYSTHINTDIMATGLTIIMCQQIITMKYMMFIPHYLVMQSNYSNVKTD